MALQLATLELLSDLKAGRPSVDPTLDELLFGMGGSTSGEAESGDPVGRLAGTKGAAGLFQLARAIESDPARWSAYCDSQAAVKCGATSTGLPWSMTLYGERCVHFDNVRQKEMSETFHKFWVMLSALHALDCDGQHALLGARLRQFLKAVEQCVAAGGSWKLAWLLTGLPDPHPRNAPGVGLLHPSEFAAAASFVREMDALETIAKRDQGKRFTPGGGDSAGQGNKKGKTTPQEEGG